MIAAVGNVSSSNKSRQRQEPTRSPYSRHAWFSTSGSGITGPIVGPSPSPNAKCSMLKPRYTARRDSLGQRNTGRAAIGEYEKRPWLGKTRYAGAFMVHGVRMLTIRSFQLGPMVRI